MSECEGCEGKGYRPNTNANGYEGDKDHEVVERCDACQQYKDDFDAALAYAKDVGTRVAGVVVERPKKTAFYATIHVLINAETEGEACDTLSENFRNPELGILDWGYVTAGGVITGPVETNVSNNYEEGAFLPDAAKAVGL